MLRIGAGMRPVIIAVVVLLLILVAGLFGPEAGVVTCENELRISRVGVARQLAALGYSDPQEITFEHGCYVALARDGRGMVMKVRLNPSTGEIVSRRWAFMGL